MMDKTIKTKLYTFAKMKDTVAQAIADMAAASALNDSFEDPGMVAAMEMAVGSRILSELDKRHKKGEL